MRVLVLGGDGYLGWPTAMHLARKGCQVTVLDSYLKRRLTKKLGGSLIPSALLGRRAAEFSLKTGHRIAVKIGDCTDLDFLMSVVEEAQPDAIVHYAEQPSGPYSMMGYEEAALTLSNNLQGTLALVWAVLEAAPAHCHIVKLGTMGEYGSPNTDIPEGWFDLEFRGRTARMLFPRQAGSLYHTTKILDTDLLWFYCRMRGLRVTDLMQGPVYGTETEETRLGEMFKTQLHYDDIFGTVLNRFLVQAVAGVPLTVYGSGRQTKGYINIRDTLRCVELAIRTPAEEGELRVFNQFTECFSVIELASRVQEAAERVDLAVSIRLMQNPRKEVEEHYWNPDYSGLEELGLKPVLLTGGVMVGMLEEVLRYRDQIRPELIQPRVTWGEGWTGG